MFYNHFLLLYSIAFLLVVCKQSAIFLMYWYQETKNVIIRLASFHFYMQHTKLSIFVSSRNGDKKVTKEWGIEIL